MSVTTKRCVLINPAVTADVLRPSLDWNKCVLCQQHSREALVDPSKSLRKDNDAGYDSLAAVLPDFDKLGELPQHLKLCGCDNGDGFVATFKTNFAKWHKSCRGAFSSRELHRKMAQSVKRAYDTAVVESCETANSKKVCTRSGCSSENVLRATEPTCFFCDLPAGPDNLHDVTTLNMDSKIKDCALALSDHRLLAKLAVGDMIAVEAKYHTKCLNQLYNRRRSLERERFNELRTDPLESVHNLVFAQLTAYINEIRLIKSIIPVFKLADLKKLYNDRLQQLYPTGNNTMHSTRLKEKLLAFYPDMFAKNDGRDVVLAFDETLGPALSSACKTDTDDDSVLLARAAEIVRRDIFNTLWQFDNSLKKESQAKSVPESLLTLVRMILEGPSIDIQLLGQHTAAAVAIAQLVVFNSVKHKRTTCTNTEPVVRHLKEQETPLPVYIGLAVHAATRKKRLVDKLFDVGISVSYSRVLSILDDLTSSVCSRFEADGAVCPLNFRANVFTTAAIDNIDHNPSATTARTSFHGTGISLHQHTDSTMTGDDRILTDTPVTCSSRSIQLPAQYTSVPFCKLFKHEPAVPMLSVDLQQLESNSSSNPNLTEIDWLRSLWVCWQNGGFTVDSADATFSWSAYHANQSAVIPVLNDHLPMCSMLPLFTEHAQSAAMIRHGMDVVKASVAKLNPSQTPVIACDQPLYTLAKIIQWNWPDSHGEPKFVVMFGGLHVEMAALKAIGSLLTGSGWVEVVSNAGIITVGSAEGLLSASHVRRCRHIHEVTLAALSILQHTAFANVSAHDEKIDFDCWCKEQCVSHKQFAYWSSVMQFQSSILQFVRSVRQADFSSYVHALKQLMPWFFVLDRTNYARWLSVHVRDMEALQVTHPQVYQEFKKGKFTVNKTGNKFSSIPLDQVHEQLNAVVKGDGGIIGLTDNDHAMSRLIVSGPEVSRILSEFESCMCTSGFSGQHHEQNKASQQTFVLEVGKLVNAFIQLGNPFEDQRDLVVLHTRVIVSPDVAETAGKLFELGQEQYKKFVDNRLSTSTESLFEPLRKNKLALFVNAKPAVASKLKSKIAATKNDSSLFSRLYIACQIRSSDLREFFSHENQVYPPSLSDGGNLHNGCKSDLLTCLETIQPSVHIAPKVDCVVMDGSAIVNMLRPGTAKTFEEYVTMVFMPFIYAQLKETCRVDVVWDRYMPSSIKHIARTKRGVAPRQQVCSNAPVPRNWHDFMRCDENKSALFYFLADRMCKDKLKNGKLLIGTHDINVKCSDSSYNTSLLQPCSQEEADTRMFLHAADMVNAGHTKLQIRTVDTDVVVLAITFFHKLSCEQLWIAFGVGQHLRYVPIHELASSLGPQRASALPVFHAFTGCDTVSSFVGRGKRTCWEVWKKFPSVTEAFVELFQNPNLMSDKVLSTLQRFTVLLYDSSYDCDNVNTARKKLFSSKGKTVDNIPPTLDALLQHIRRAVYQAGFVWSQSLVLEPQLPCPSAWGWQMTDNSWNPVWMTIPDAAKCCPELKRCGCKSGCITRRCKCVKDNIQCTALCACDGECRQ